MSDSKEMGNFNVSWYLIKEHLLGAIGITVEDEELKDEIQKNLVSLNTLARAYSNHSNKELSEKNINLAQQFLEKDFNPIDDMRASSKYRMKVAKNLLFKCFQEIKNKKLIRINA